jgi:hypothetical protein
MFQNSFAFIREGQAQRDEIRKIVEKKKMIPQYLTTRDWQKSSRGHKPTVRQIQHKYPHLQLFAREAVHCRSTTAVIKVSSATEPLRWLARIKA